MSITLGPFFGLMPKADPKLLNPQHATVAADCDLSTGSLAPAFGSGASIAALLNNTKTLYWFNREANSGLGYWLQWSNDVDVVRGPIPDDPYLRTYFTGDGAPKYTNVTLAQQGSGPYPGASRNLGLPPPSAPSATGPSGTLPAGAQKVSTAYVMTYVSDMGEEGPPSEPSNIVDRWDGATVNLSSLSVASGSFVIVSKRIYRIELNDVYQYVGEVGAATTTFVDNFDTEFLGEPVPSSEWVTPHASMVGLTSLPGGILAGFWGNTIAFSEPSQPHAWPIRYRIALDYDVVGMAVSAYGLVVSTTGTPYLVSGSSPAAMGTVKMDLAAACASKRSMVDMGDVVVYATAEGLIGAGGTDARLITSEHITPKQWREKYFPASIHAVRDGDRYLGFYSGGAFSFSPSEGFKDFTQTADCTFLDEAKGEIYIKAGTQLRKWWAGSAISFTYRTKIFSIAPGNPLMAAKVVASSYPVTLKFYADGVLKKTKTVASKTAFRLPANDRYSEFEIELSGTSSISGIQLAFSMSEIV